MTGRQCLLLIFQHQDQGLLLILRSRLPDLDNSYPRRRRASGLTKDGQRSLMQNWLDEVDSFTDTFFYHALFECNCALNSSISHSLVSSPYQSLRGAKIRCAAKKKKVKKVWSLSHTVQDLCGLGRINSSPCRQRPSFSQADPPF